MATVHRETNWGADPGASTQKWEVEPRKGSSVERLKRRSQVEPSALSRSTQAALPKKEESPTIEISVEFGDAEADAAIVIAVTEDHELRSALIEALSRDVVLFAETPEQVLARPVPDNCGVLIVEQSLGRSTFEKLKSHLKASAPAMVSIMVGTQVDGSSLVGLLSAGSIDRFMVKPLKLGPTRSALRSALQQHQSQRHQSQQHSSPQAQPQRPVEVERARPTLFAVESGSKAAPIDHANLQPGPLVDAEALERREQEIVARGTPIVLPSAAIAHLNSANVADPVAHARAPATELRALAETRRGLTTPSWSLVAAVIIAIAGFVAWGMSTRTPDLNVGKLVASHLVTAQKAFEVGHYVDPPELSAVHFYTAALEMDPGNAQAKRGLESVADKLIADAKQLINAGDLLRAQSTLDSIRRVQSSHRELTAVNASLLQARDAERIAINAAHSTSKQIAEPSAVVLPAAAALIQKEVATEKAHAPIERKVSPQRQERAETKAVQAVKPISVPSRSAESKPVVAVAPPMSLNSLTAPSQEETVARVAPNLAATAAAEAATLPSAAVPSAGSVGSTNSTGPANDKMKLVKYVPPVYPSIARGSNTEGWLDVNFHVTTDGSVVDPSIGNGTAGRLFHRAAINAVSQWKFSPAPSGMTEQRPMHVRLEFKLTN